MEYGIFSMFITKIMISLNTQNFAFSKVSHSIVLYLYWDTTNTAFIALYTHAYFAKCYRLS